MGYKVFNAEFNYELIKVYEIFSKIDYQILNQLINFLKNFYELRLNLCKDSAPTLHLVLPTKQKMLLLCNHIDNDLDIIKKLKDIYKDNIEKYMKISDMHIISTFLYPPLRSLNKLINNDIKSEIHSKISQMLSEIKITETLKEIISTDNELDLCLQDFVDLSQNVSVNESEITSYINSSINYNMSSSVIQFWDQNNSCYPKLSILAKRLLSIPATNLSSERNFSVAGHTLTDQRSNLKPITVNHLLFIRSNYDLI